LLEHKSVSRRLQIQERLTKEVAIALFDILQPKGIGVVVDSSHLCMSMRGIQKTATSTTTSYMLGIFHSDTRKREEFLNLVRRK
jgi:GTP cyclohydrolase IA